MDFSASGGIPPYGDYGKPTLARAAVERLRHCACTGCDRERNAAHRADRLLRSEPSGSRNRGVLSTLGLVLRTRSTSRWLPIRQLDIRCGLRYGPNRWRAHATDHLADADPFPKGDALASDILSVSSLDLGSDLTVVIQTRAVMSPATTRPSTYFLDRLTKKILGALVLLNSNLLFDCWDHVQ